ncbi:sensor histidine kinase [Pseudonocardia hispaniensis]|uniref:histidine kinase n=1 Tax=Pseudonocardia hispaniensis TaxID=904933 RepID=A0ABW1J5S7_9PSEU
MNAGARFVQRAALPLTGITLAMVGIGTGLALAAGVPVIDLVSMVFVVACGITGGLVLRQRPTNTVGVLLLGSAACFAALEACGRAARWLEGPPAVALGWPQTWLWVPANALLAAVPVFFPGGRAGPRWRWPLAVFTALVVVTALLNALRPGPDNQLGAPGRPNPLGVPGLAPVADAFGTVFTLGTGLVVVAAGIGQVAGLRRADPERRRQVEILAYAVGLAALVIIARLVAGLTDDDPDAIFPLGSLPWELAGGVAGALLPVAVGIAVIRHQLFDIDRLIGRTVLLVVLSGCVAGTYLAVVALAGAWLAPVLGSAVELPAALLGAGLAAVLFAPLRSRLQRRVERLLYGERGDPYAVLSRLGRRLELVQDAGSLQTVAATVRDALQLSSVAIEVDGGQRVALGPEPAEPAIVPLVAAGERIGRLVLGPRPGERTLGRRDLRVLRELARPIAGAARAAREADRAVRLAADLQRSRERLVIAREEERRRLRRDLHDGLGPALAGLTMRAEAARELGPAQARDLLAEIVAEAQSALGDVRRLVDGLRPPALDTLGLTGAVEAHLRGRPGATPVAVDVPAPLPELPAAVEVAAYRIALEAVTNVDRHAAARSACLRLALEGGALVVEVTDDGRGGAAGRDERDAGVGLSSIRERAAELGGSCTVIDRVGGGTQVRAVLPLRRAEESEGGPCPDPARR